MIAEKIVPGALLVQGTTTLMISFLSTLISFVYSWPSYTVANFRSNDTVLSAPMTSLEVSLLGSLTNVGGLVATPLCGYAMNKLGRKYTSLLFGLPFVICWTIISITNYIPLVLAAIALSGFGAGGQVLTTIYVAEISQDSVRGTFTSTVSIGYFLGLLMSYAWGGYLSYNNVIYIHLALSVFYVLMMLLLKESPVFLIQKGKEEEAAKSIAFYRRIDVNSKEVEIEIEKLKRQMKPVVDNSGEAVRSSSAWQFLLNSESSKCALLTCIIIMILKTFMGAITLQVYAETLFKIAVPTMSPYLCTILMAVDNVVASVICSLLIDRLGRKFLMIISSVGSGICTLLLGTQLLFDWAPGIFTAIVIYAFAFIYIVGANAVIFVVAAEVFLPEVRGLCNSLIMTCMWAVNFLALMIFVPVVENFGMHSAFFGFSVISFLGALYSYWCLPETKGLAVEAIQALFVKNRRKNDKC
ncbi:facilitated trehalose transporter Tret1-like isoform X2 [Plodia interpunctella]|uniref:facilitated trehalose transporter Tret1-like isoform X2 n=1 Tax=Plodia interpunctella TaxID=58824 RepID=UPI002368580E|nr:facilitated trehalose transporter Tret1-like isoform X2 [Plodia interpunctella]